MRKARCSWASTGISRLPYEHLCSLIVFSLTFLLVFKDPVPRGLTLLQLAAMLLAAILLLTRSRVLVSQQGKVYAFGLLLAFAWALGTTLVGALAGTTHLQQGIRDIRDFGVFVSLSIAFILLFRSADCWRAFMWGGALGIAVEVLLRNWPSWYDRLFNPAYMGVRFQAGFLSPNEYSAFASLILVVSFWCLLNSRSRRPVYLVFSLLALYVMLTTFSRGGLVGAGAGVLAVLLLSRQRIARPSSLIVVALLGLGILFVLLRSTSSFDYLLQRFTFESLVDGLRGRQSLGGPAVEILQTHPLFGAGWGGFALLNARLGGTGTASPHNEVLKAATDGGLLGILLMLFVLLYPVKVLLKGPSVRTPLVPMLIAFLTAEMFFSHLARPNLSLVFAMLVGIIFSLRRHRTVAEQASQPVDHQGQVDMPWSRNL